MGLCTPYPGLGLVFLVDFIVGKFFIGSSNPLVFNFEGCYSLLIGGFAAQ